MARDLSALREHYRNRGLRRAELAADPFTQFERWFDEVVITEAYDPNAMVLATADADGRPAARFVLLKGVDRRGFALFTNGESPKAADLAANPRAALTFGWLELARQVRVTGAVEVVAADEADTYWATRPRGSQLGAWASEQSQVIADRAELERRAAEVAERFTGGEVPRPPRWGGFRVVPDTVEFWQGRPDRLHDRFRFSRAAGDGWAVDRLAP
ncbi:pyridoxamine 5'-phosphate oxidase [soil metagenome]